MRVLAAAGLVLMLLAATPPSSLSAVEKEPARRKPALSYFPLEVGNWWVYGGLLGAVSVTDRVTAANGLDYFELNGYIFDKHLVRLSRLDVVSELNAGGGEDFLWYMLGAPVGTTWQIQLPPGKEYNCLRGVSVRVASRSDVVKVPAGEFRNVVRLVRGPVCCDCGITAEWFAPGVGLIRRQEITISGIEVSELLDAQVGGVQVWHPRYDVSLSLDRPSYEYNLYPPAGPDAFPAVRAIFVLRNETDIPLPFTFLGCKTVTLSVVNDIGVVMQARAYEQACSGLTDPVDFTLVNGSWVIVGSFRLKMTDGRRLPDGRYTLVATLDTLDPVPLRPSARAVFDVTTTN